METQNRLIFPHVKKTPMYQNIPAISAENIGYHSDSTNTHTHTPPHTRARERKKDKKKKIIIKLEMGDEIV